MLQSGENKKKRSKDLVFTTTIVRMETLMTTAEVIVVSTHIVWGEESQATQALEMKR